jgi:hypothetical protein
MLLVYIATLAPSVTFWDAGEFIAAARVLGIPHPPGTPLFVVLLNAWARAFWFLPFAQATNLFSAVCTAAALALAAWWIARATNASWFGIAGAVTAGAMSSLWQNATETEVYAASVFLSVASVAAADTAGRTGERRWKILAAYLLALALPLHLSAFVAAPVVVYLASQPTSDAFDWRTAIAMTGACAFVLGVSRLSAPLVLLSIAVMLASRVGAVWAAPPNVQQRGSPVPVPAMFAVMLVACSALFIVVVRARHDPPINQANAATLRDLAYVVGRQQYDVAGLWPRQAPLWLQIANWFEYADWQVALSLAPTVIPTIWRVLVTVAFAGLALFGASWHRRTDRRSWRALLLLFICGSAGVIAYLNLKAGTSFGWAFVTDAERHEARDRDYFFVLGFLAWGLWAGMGAMALAQRFRLPRAIGLTIAALPLALNWAIVTRRAEPEASLPREFAKALLEPLPQRTVLFVAGDNDTYPLWFAQQVEGLRRDVTVVTMPLLGAPWYVAEIERRHHLVGPAQTRDPLWIARRIAEAARAAGRPVAVSLTVPKADRSRLGDEWTATGLVAIASDQTTVLPDDLDSAWTAIPVWRSATERSRASIEAWRNGRTVRPSTEPVHEYVFEMLSCPDLALRRSPSKAQLVSLDSLCNLR